MTVTPCPWGCAGWPWEGLGQELHFSESLISGPPPAMSVSWADLSPGMSLEQLGQGQISPRALDALFLCVCAEQLFVKT